jgi:hypothetical protein
VIVTGDLFERAHGARGEFFIRESNRKPVYQGAKTEFYDGGNGMESTMLESAKLTT